MKSLLLFFVLVSSNLWADTVEIKGLKSEYQGAAPWCWAASANMVLKFYGIKAKTCEIVSKTMGLSCCGVLGDKDCWKGGNVRSALAQYGIQYKYDELVKNEKDALNPNIASRIIKMLRNNQIPLIHLKNTNSKSFDHIAVIKAAEDFENFSTLTFKIYDPANGTMRVSGQDLLKGYYRTSSDTYYFDGLFYPAN